MTRLLITFLLALTSALPAMTIAEPVQHRVAVITTLSGTLATIGTAVKNGIELARADHPKLFESIEFSYEDDQFDAKQGLSAYRKLKESKRPIVLFGFGTVLAQAIGPLIERDEMPLINFNFEAAPAIGKRFIVRGMNHTDQYMKSLGEYLAAQGNADLPIVQTE